MDEMVRERHEKERGAPHVAQFRIILIKKLRSTSDTKRLSQTEDQKIDDHHEVSVMSNGSRNGVSEKCDLVS